MKDLLTIFNYPNNDTYNVMLHTWLKCANKFSNGFNIKILSSNDPNEYIKNLNKIYNFKWIKCDHYKGDLSILGSHKHKHNITFKLWNIYKNENPFIFIDADAFILKDINEMWKYKDDKPFIGINHQNIPIHTSDEPELFLNSGVLVVSDPSFINYEEIIKNYKGMKCKGFDQAILFSHFKQIGYDYTHPNIGSEWNACAGYTKLQKINGDWEGKTFNLHPSHEVYINHYWDEFRPWTLKCPLYLETWKSLKVDII